MIKKSDLEVLNFKETVGRELKKIDRFVEESQNKAAKTTWADAKDHYAKSEKYFAEQKYDETVSELHLARTFCTKALAIAKQLDQAKIRQMLDNLAAHLKNINPLVKMSENRQARDKYQESLELYKKAVASNSKNEPAEAYVYLKMASTVVTRAVTLLNNPALSVQGENLKQSKNEISKAKDRTRQENGSIVKAISQRRKTQSPQEISFSEKKALMLLYVGTVLISFSILVFVAFNWQTFTNGVKCGLLLAFTGAFYLGGMVFYKTDMFRSAGVTFITIASIAFGLTGIGLWRFGLNDYVGFDFKTYWILYSILLLLVYALTSYRTQLARFYYLTVAAFYSLTVTTGIRITDDLKKQLAFILGINLIFYFCSGLFGKYEKPTRIVSRTLNLLLDWVIFCVILTAVITATSLPDAKWLMSIVLGLPLLTNAAIYLREQDKIETSFSIVLLLFKILLISSVYAWNADTVLLVLSAYIIILEILRLSTVDRGKVLFAGMVAQILIWVTVLGIFMFFTVDRLQKQYLTSYGILLVSLVVQFAVLNTKFIYQLIKEKAANPDMLLSIGFSAYILWGFWLAGYGKLEFKLIILILAVVALLFNFMFRAGNTANKEQLSKYFLYSSIWMSAIMIIVSVGPLFVIKDNYLVAAFLILGLNLISLYNVHELLCCLCSLPWILVIWKFAIESHANIQFYSLPVALNLGILSWRYYLNEKPNHGVVFESLAYSTEFTVLLCQSFTNTESLNIFYGIILIVLSVSLFILAFIRKNTALMIIAALFLVIELIVRLYQVILSIPWWMHIGVIGLIVILSAVYLLWKIDQKKKWIER